MTIALRSAPRAAAIHGDLTQNKRRRALAGFDEGRHDVLVATDLVARGIDIEVVGTPVHDRRLAARTSGRLPCGIVVR